MPAPRAQAGATLVETIMVAAICAITACIALPSMSGMLAKERLVQAQNVFIQDLGHARELAARTRRRVVMCPSADGARCAPASHWHGGWLVGPAVTRSTDSRSELSGPASRIHSGYKDITIISTEGRQFVAFQPHGRASGYNASFVLCGRRNAKALSVVVAMSGRIRADTASADQAQACKLAAAA